MQDFGVGIVSTGHYLPENIQTNEELCKSLLDVTPEWIIEKTGIKRRYFVSEGESASSMAVNACKSIFDKTGITASEIGLIVVASFSQDYLFPPLSAKLHKELGAPKDCQIFDINTNCTGSVTAMTLAAERMQSNHDIKYSLVIGVEVLSRFTNKCDKDTAIFFSDGASAVLLGKVEKGYGLINSKFLTDSSTYESVRLRGGGSTYPMQNRAFDAEIDFIEQNGLATWKQAVGNLPVVLNSVIKASNLTISDIDFFVFHQANNNLISYILKKLKIPEDRTRNNVEEIGNTGAASIGLALSEAYDANLIKPNSYLALAGVGAGFNFGASLWRIQ
ncbi:MAG: ketoacyl-ACP synthase III [Chitinophagaceae bacterium]|nr:MAG: ketoacyl-ACP synthase III [Chitinophagaceae bacterium]